MSPREKVTTRCLSSLRIAAAMLAFPTFVTWRVLTTLRTTHNEERSMRRIVGDSSAQYVSAQLDIRLLQSAFGSTLDVYMKWAKKNKAPSTIDELGDAARLLWIGPKPEKLEFVVLLCHGGGYFLPPTGFYLSFWRYVQGELAKHGIEAGFALLNYSLKPTASFPTPLKQACAALEFLFTSGLQPQNLQIAGDSAGGNLVMQVLSHMLHPHPLVPEIRLQAPLQGICLISPWVSLTTDAKSYVENAKLDYTSAKVLEPLGRQVLSDFPEKYKAFAEPVKAPETWFEGVENLVGRILISAGGAECMRDDIVDFGEHLEKRHPNIELFVQKNGLHEDNFLDFMVREQKLGSLTPLIVKWLTAGFTQGASSWFFTSLLTHVSSHC
ncbi:Alpha/Beta hydrolase protein [Mycena epipterygia]|nr:Alpha/Beta hydrolase protein [Mycena epipterygia]